jgi:hypothetical protein
VDRRRTHYQPSFWPGPDTVPPPDTGPHFKLMARAGWQTHRNMEELEDLLSSLRLKKVLLDNSRSYIQKSEEKLMELKTELQFQSVKLDAGNSVLEALEDAFLRQKVECMRTTRRYVELGNDYTREENRMKAYKVHDQPEPPNLNSSPKTVSLGEGDDFDFVLILCNAVLYTSIDHD